MNDSNKPFENKIRSKLEAYEAPYQPKYWKRFKSKHLPAAWLSLAKLWYMPYVFSSLLIGALAWIFWNQNPMQKGFYTQETKTDTVYVYQTLTQKDTLVVYDTVYVYSRPGVSSLRSKSLVTQNPAPTNNAATNTKPIAGAIIQGNKQSNGVDDPHEPQQALTEEQILKAQYKELARLQRQRRAQADSIKKLEESSNTALAEHKEAVVDSLTLEEADAENEENLAVIKQTKTEAPKTETAEKPKKEKKERKPRQWNYGLGMVGSYYLPLDYQNIDFMGGASFGVSASLGLNRWGLDLGAQPGMLVYEYDDLTREDVQRFPDYANLTAVPEDIEIWTTQLFMPLQIGYDFVKTPSWGLSARAGVLSQVLIRENYEYVFDEGDQEVIRSAPSSSRFLFSHVSVGMNAQYKISEKWQIESGLMYHHPLQRLGYSGFRTPLLPLTLGLRRTF